MGLHYTGLVIGGKEQWSNRGYGPVGHNGYHTFICCETFAIGRAEKKNGRKRMKKNSVLIIPLMEQSLLFLGNPHVHL